MSKKHMIFHKWFSHTQKKVNIVYQMTSITTCIKMHQRNFSHCPYLFNFAETDIYKRCKRKHTPKPTQRAAPACLAAAGQHWLAAHHRFLSKSAQGTLKLASDQASVNKCIWQRMCISFHLPGRSWDRNKNLMNTLLSRLWALFSNENKLVDDAVRPRSSDIAAGAA